MKNLVRKTKLFRIAVRRTRIRQGAKKLRQEANILVEIIPRTTQSPVVGDIFLSLSPMGAQAIVYAAPDGALKCFGPGSTTISTLTGLAREED